MPTAKLDTGTKLHPDTVVEWPFRTFGAVKIKTPARIGAYTQISACDVVSIAEIGRYCTIGPGFRCGDADYPVNWLTSSSAVYDRGRFDWALGRYPVRPAPEPRPDPVIGNDVWIGSNVTVMRGVTIGDGAVVGVGSVVADDVPPYAVVEGVPAKVVRYRFPPEVIRVLLSVKWWEFDAYLLQDVPMEAPAKAVAMIVQLEKAGSIHRSPPRHQGLAESPRHVKDVKALEELEFSAEIYAGGVELLEDLERFLAHVPLPPLQAPPAPTTDQHIIMTSNSGHSGAAAIGGYLSQSNVVQMPFGNTKLSCLHAKHGALAVLAKPTRATLSNVIRACVLGIPHEPKPTELAVKHAKERALSRLFSQDTAKMLALFGHARLMMRDAEAGDIVAAFSRFVNSALRLKVNGPVVYFENAIPQHLLKVFPLFENATCLAVMRDARDQFIAHSTEGKTAPLAADVFIKRRIEHNEALFAVTHPQLWTISFEDFVRDEGLRLDLLDRLGIPPESMTPDSSRFNLAALQKRIGVHKGWADQDVVRQVAEGLPSMLHD